MAGAYLLNTQKAMPGFQSPSSHIFPGSRHGVQPQEVCGRTWDTVVPHLSAAVVQLEGQHHGSIHVDLLDPINVLRADLQPSACTFPSELGSLGGKRIQWSGLELEGQSSPTRGAILCGGKERGGLGVWWSLNGTGKTLGQGPYGMVPRPRYLVA